MLNMWNQKLISLAVISQRLSNRRVARRVGPFIGESRIRNESLSSAPKKTKKKNVYTHFCYLFRKQEKETHEAADRAQQVGIESG